MIRLLFTLDREVLIFEIENKTIIYRDRKWQQGIKFIPKDLNFIKKVLFSRNKISYKMIDWINEANSGKNLEQWNNCKDDEDVAKIVIEDAKSRGCVLRNKVINPITETTKAIEAAAANPSTEAKEKSI